MTSPLFASLPHRVLIAVTGDERKTFLQGLVSADIAKLDRDHARYGAFLTADGRFLHEFFVLEGDDAILLETERERAADFIKRLTFYRLRAKVAFSLRDDLAVHAVFGEGAAIALGLDGAAGSTRLLDGGVVFVDPRLPQAGLRAWMPAAAAFAPSGCVAATTTDWDVARLRLGLPDGGRDLVAERSLLLEAGFDELNGIDWKKGCYLGQEATARVKHRGEVRKRLLPVAIEGEAPPFGTPLMLGEATAGEMRSSAGHAGLAMIRLEHFETLQKDGGTLTAPGARLVPGKPAWMAF